MDNKNNRHLIIPNTPKILRINKNMSPPTAKLKHRTAKVKRLEDSGYAGSKQEGLGAFFDVELDASSHAPCSISSNFARPNWRKATNAANRAKKQLIDLVGHV